MIENKINFKFFTNNNGYSSGIYSSLNCGEFSKDNKINIKNNIDYAKNFLGYPGKVLIIPKQYHSNKCLIIHKDSDGYESADALVTKSNKFILGVTTADCIPIIFYDIRSMTIGICHAGWKGLSSGIIENTINKMQELGSLTKNINALIGPCIRKKSYEVKKDFLLNFKSVDISLYTIYKNDKIYFDLPLLASNILKNHKIKNVKDCRKNTYLDKNYFSFRRSKVKKYQDYGRNLNLITINSFE